jgi:cbb3-type cytochrome oxidase subunit 3
MQIKGGTFDMAGLTFLLGFLIGYWCYEIYWRTKKDNN